MYIVYLDLLQKFEELRSQGESIDAIGAIMLEWVSVVQLAYCHALIQYMYCSSPDIHIPIYLFCALTLALFVKCVHSSICLVHETLLMGDKCKYKQ